MAKKDKVEVVDEVPHLRKELRPDFSKPLPPERLPDDLQKIVDKQDTLFEELYDGTAPDSTDTSVRYAAYATRIRTLLLSAQRYVAYTSDVGESFRPVAHPWLIRTAYGISWAYLAGDVANEGYKAYTRNQRVLNPALAAEKAAAKNGPEAQLVQQQQLVPSPGKVPPIEDYRVIMTERAIFQAIASMGLPAFTIHSIVRYSGRALRDAKNKTIRTYGPIGLGLAAVPFLPFVFDKPVEEAVEWTFHKAFETLYGEEAVRGRGPTGRAAQLQAESKAASKKEKEL